MSSGGANGSDKPYYGRARIVLAGVFGALVAVLMTIDAIRPDYILEPIPLGLLLGTITYLLGVEGFSRLMGRDR